MRDGPFGSRLLQFVCAVGELARRFAPGGALIEDIEARRAAREPRGSVAEDPRHRGGVKVLGQRSGIRRERGESPDDAPTTRRTKRSLSGHSWEVPFGWRIPMDCGCGQSARGVVGGAPRDAPAESSTAMRGGR